MYEGAIDPDSESLHQAQAAARNLRTTLEELGIPVSERLEQFPEQLHNLYFAPDQAQNFQENAANLEEMADRIEQTATAIARSLRAMAQKQREHADQSKRGSPKN